MPATAIMPAAEITFSSATAIVTPRPGSHPLNLGHLFGARLFHRDRIADEGFDFGQMERVMLTGETDGFTLGAQPRRAANAVDVVLRVLGQIEIERRG